MYINNYKTDLLSEVHSPQEPAKIAKKRVKREYPPIGSRDTVIMRDGEFESIHGKARVFFDYEILKVHQIVKLIILPSSYGEDVKVGYTRSKRAVLQQQATRGCTAATAAMLLLDHGCKVDIQELKTRNLGTNEHQLRDLKKGGLNPIEVSISEKTAFKALKSLRRALKKRSSAIVSLSDPSSGAMS